MLESEDPQLARDEEIARQLQQQEFRGVAPSAIPNALNRLQQRPSQGSVEQDISAPLLNNDALNNEGNDEEQPNPNEARQIRNNVIDNFREAGQESPRILLARITIGLLECVATATVLAIGWHESCDEPLKYWLLSYSARHFITVPLRIYIYRLSRQQDGVENMERAVKILRWLSILTFLWFLVGQSFLFTGKNCENTAPTVWYYSLVIIILVYVSLALPFLIVLAICICLPCVLIVFRFFAEPEGAGTEIIKKLPTKKITKADIESATAAAAASSSSTTNDPDQPATANDDGDGEDSDNDDRPSCAICMQDYQVGDEVRVLPCEHEFHITCVDKWLPLKKVCPLCRHDITQPKPEPQPPQTDAAPEPDAAPDALERQAMENSDLMTSVVIDPNRESVTSQISIGDKRTSTTTGVDGQTLEQA